MRSENRVLKRIFLPIRETFTKCQKPEEKEPRHPTQYNNLANSWMAKVVGVGFEQQKEIFISYEGFRTVHQSYNSVRIWCKIFGA
jgi:hypothetical protein